MTAPAAMPLAARFSSGPAVTAGDDTDVRVKRWLDDISSPQREAILAILEQYPLARAVVTGIADASPYLFDLLRGNAERVHRVLTSDPDRQLADLIDNVRSAAIV